MTDAPSVTGPGQARFDFHDRVVVVTGASGGIGSALVDAFAAAGADVVLHGRDADALAAGVARVGEHGRSAIAVQGNVRSAETAQAIADAARPISELSVFMQTTTWSIPAK